MEMVEFIKQIPGPVFIWLFLVFSLICIVLMRFLTDADGTASRAPVVEAGLDAVAVAVLQGGADSVIRSRVFSLMSRGLVAIENEKKKMRIHAVSGARNGGLSALDAEIMAFLSIERTPEALFTDKDFRARIEAHLADVRAGLELRHLVKGKVQQERAVRIALLFGALIAAFGGLKLYLGVMRAKPIVFLVISLLVSEVIVFLIFRKRKYLTRLGRVYLKNLRERFNWTKKRRTLPQGVDPALLVALFGAGHVYVSSLYPQYTEAFKRNAAGGSGCSGGCGGGSSSDGGSSGGGCGGCGGCGGD
ncbi:MAG: TIGR04222 domain-containing membrane protein [Deltaproteobacteria bacterium]|nr:TIGR04222 domain-containing membrane protein [Deltaproteobacteria bacterium]